MPKRRARATLEDVARVAGVHYSTVSRALDPNKEWRVSDGTRKLVQNVARRLGYLPDVRASGLKRGRSQTVAVVVGDVMNLNVAPVLRAINNYLEPRGILPLICETEDFSDRLQRILNHLLSRRIDAILVLSARAGDGAILRRMRRQGVPLMLGVQNVAGVRFPLAAYDDVLGGRLAAQHLLSLGHRHFAQLPGPSDISSIIDRCSGFSKAVAAAGATETVIEGAGPGDVDDGRRLMHKVLERRKSIPTAVFAHHDLMAIGALAVARERGLEVPKDISIMGYHDLPHVAQIDPPLTSIRLPREDLGRVAAEMMLRLVDKPEQMPEARRLPPILVIRKSTGPPPKKTR